MRLQIKCESHPFKHNWQAKKYKEIDYTALVVKCVFNKQINMCINYVLYSMIF